MKRTHILYNRYAENNLNLHCTDNHHTGKTTGLNHSYTVSSTFDLVLSQVSYTLLENHNYTCLAMFHSLKKPLVK